RADGRAGGGRGGGPGPGRAVGRTAPPGDRDVGSPRGAANHPVRRPPARDAGRFALTHLQVRGAAGQVVGTDGRRALVWGGFRLPFGCDLLVPAVPAFGSRELADVGDVRVGRTPTELVVAVGPWRVHLPVNTSGKFPDVASVIPRAGAGSSARIDGRD